MKTFDIEVKERETGKKASKKLRQKGLVPVNLYGQGKNYNLCADERLLNKIYFTPDTYVINIKYNNEVKKAIIKEVQLHPVTDRIMHVDLYEISEDKPFEVELPIKITGVAKGVQMGGKLVQEKKFLKVKGLLKDMPDYIEIDVTNLGLGKTLHVKDLKLDKLTIVNRPEDTIVKVEVTRLAKEEIQTQQQAQTTTSATTT